MVSFEVSRCLQSKLIDNIHKGCLFAHDYEVDQIVDRASIASSLTRPFPNRVENFQTRIARINTDSDSIGENPWNPCQTAFASFAWFAVHLIRPPATFSPSDPPSSDFGAMNAEKELFCRTIS